MAEWEEKLEGILSNPQAMEQIMSLAKSLEGGENSASPSSLKWVDRTIGAPLCSRPCGPL